MYELGRRIRKFREEKGMTRAQLAVATDISGAHMGRIEKGESRVTHEVLFNLARALDKTVSDLFGDATERISAYALIYVNDDADEQLIEKLSDLFCSMSHVTDSFPFKEEKKILVHLLTPRFEEVGDFVIDYCQILQGISNTETIFVLRDYTDDLEEDGDGQAHRAFVFLSVPYKIQERVANVVKGSLGVTHCYAVSGHDKDILVKCSADSINELRGTVERLKKIKGEMENVDVVLVLFSVSKLDDR